MNSPVEVHSTSLRVAHLHASLEWGDAETQILSLVLRMQATGIFTVLVTPAGGELARRALRAGVRVLPLESGRLARRQLSWDLGEFDLTLLHANDSASISLGGWLKRRLRIPLVLTRRMASPLRRNPFSRWKYSPRRLDAVIAISGTVRDVMVHSGVPAERIHVVPSGDDDEQRVQATVAAYESMESFR